MGFEPTRISPVALKAIALNHSATLVSTQLRGIFIFCLKELRREGFEPPRLSSMDLEATAFTTLPPTRGVASDSKKSGATGTIFFLFL